MNRREILKAGFGLGSDLAQLKARLGIEPRKVLDLSRVLRGEKPSQSLGAKTAVARYFGQRMQKSRKVIAPRSWSSRWSDIVLSAGWCSRGYSAERTRC